MLKDNLKRIRKEKRITQKQLASLSGLSFSMVSKLESGEQSNPSYDTVKKIASALGSPLQSLLGEENECAQELINCIDKQLIQVKGLRSEQSIETIADMLTIDYLDVKNILLGNKSLTTKQENLLFNYLKTLDYECYQEMYNRFRHSECIDALNIRGNIDLVPILKKCIEWDFETHGIKKDENKINKLVDDILEFKKWKLYELTKDMQ